MQADSAFEINTLCRKNSVTPVAIGPLEQQITLSGPDLDYE